MHKLYLSKTKERVAFVAPLFVLKFFVEPFLANLRYYLITDSAGNLKIEREIVDADPATA